MLLSTTRKLFGISILLAVVIGCVLGISMSSASGGGYSGYSAATVDPVVLVVSTVLLLVAVVLETVAWIGALVKTAQLGRWGWFICMLLPFISGFAFLGYVLFGPTEAAYVYQSRPSSMQPGAYISSYQSPQQPQYGQAQYGQSQYYPPSSPGQPPYGRPD